jgi:hypothetical protein
LKLFRDLRGAVPASTSGAFRDVPTARLFEEISTLRTDDWIPGTVDAIATGAQTAPLVIKAVNYGAERTSLLVRFRAPAFPKAVASCTRSAPGQFPSLENPNRLLR